MGKILYRIMIDSIRSAVDDRLRKEPAGYKKGSGTTEQVFILRNIVEQVNELQAALYLKRLSTLSTEKACGQSRRKTESHKRLLKW